VSWKKIQQIGGVMTFDGFVWSILELTRRCIGDAAVEDSDVQAALVEVISNFENEKDKK
jgi:hypothetical protein